MNELARYKMTKSISFQSLQPGKVLLVNGDNLPQNRTEEIDVRLLQYGDGINIPPNVKIAADGNDTTTYATTTVC